MSDKKQPNELNIELPQEVAEGTYSNLVILNHSNTEFVLDFARIVPNVPQARIKSRIILTPQHAKRLLLALRDNVQKYESSFGQIKEHQAPNYPTGYSGPKGMA